MIDSFAPGFVTNSSTACMIVLLNKKQVRDLEQIDLDDYIQNYFDEFSDKYLPTHKTQFVRKVKSLVPTVFKRVITTLRKTTFEFVKFEAICDVDGSSWDLDDPESYAALFVLIYVLKDFALDSKYWR